MRLITLSNGQQTQVSDEDFIWASGFYWNIDYKKYVRTTVLQKTHRLHRLIAKRAKIDCQNQIDHIDGNPLNNQRENLRAATNIQNCRNQRKSRNNTSGYTGVSWDKECQKWCAYIYIDGKRVNLGRYNIKEAAAYVRKIAEQKYFGEFANTGEKHDY